MARAPRLFTLLVDLSFTEFLTARLAGAMYRVAVVGIGLVTGSVVVYGFARHPELGLFLATGAVAGFVVAVLVVRLWLEAAVVLARIAERTEEIAEQVAGIAVDVAGVVGSRHVANAGGRGP